MFRQNGEQADHPVQLPRALLRRAVDDAVDTGAVLMHFSGGGEPLLNRHTLETMQYAVARGLKVALTTNGSLLTPAVAATVDYLRVSLNAGTARQHQATNHGGDPDHPGDWLQILQNVRDAVPAKRQDIGLGFVVDHENWPDIYPFCRRAAELGVDFVHIRPAFYFDPAADAATRAAMERALVECDLAQRKFGDQIQIFAITEKFDGYWTPRTYDQCKAIWTGVCLRATGDFAVCQDRTDLTFGQDWAGGASFASVWRSPARQALVDQIRSPGELERCPRCVWNTRNVILKEVFEDDALRLALV
jgi:MoaA/NifB/PqqE/SkfB family radical SAM enzyme